MLNKIISLISILLMLGQGGLQSYVDQTNIGGNLYIVNRKFYLSPDYVPSNMRRVNVKSINGAAYLKEEAADALEAMFKAAKDESRLNLVVVSAYRSYYSQRNIYTRKLRRSNGSVEEAQKYVAPPGTSEHQLGTTCDIGRANGSGDLVPSFGSSEEGKWVAQNGHRFGFIIRYEKQWEDVTGYLYEPWHIRYVGVEHATRIYELKLPLEYYVDAIKQASFSDFLFPEEKNPLVNSLIQNKDRTSKE